MKPVTRWTRLAASRFRTGGINRAPSPVLAHSTPWLSIMLASLLPTMPVIASTPLLPPFGFLLLLAWRQVRPGLLPVWAGLPLGVFDDIYSGQPFGSAILLWSSAMIALEVIDARIPWRSYVIDWLAAAAIVLAYLLLTLVFANAAGGAAQLSAIVPQAVTAVLLYPLAGRLVAVLDRVRLTPIMDLK